MKRCPHCNTAEKYATVQTYKHFYVAVCNACSKFFVVTRK